MLGYVSRRTVDQGLAEILHRFDTLYTYLVLIASENRLKDPFDQRVVEAYWLGNSLLGNVKTKALADHAADGLVLKKKVPAKKYGPMMDAIVEGGLPQHNFHVFTIFVRTGHHAVAHTLSTMDSCRISWGRVVGEVVSKTVLGKQFWVEMRPLEYRNDKLTLGVTVKKAVMSVAVKPKIGDWVSMHWGYICDILTDAKRASLLHYTNRALSVANRS